MKIAVSSKGKDENSMVSELSGRCPYYLLFEDGKLLKAISNLFRFGGGAGFAVAEMLSDEGVGLVISGSFGANMVSTLGEKGIKHKEIKGMTVKEALKKVIE